MCFDNTLTFKKLAMAVDTPSNAITRGNYKRIAVMLSNRHSHRVSDNGLGVKSGACFLKIVNLLTIFKKHELFCHNEKK